MYSVRNLLLSIAKLLSAKHSYSPRSIWVAGSISIFDLILNCPLVHSDICSQRWANSSIPSLNLQFRQINFIIVAALHHQPIFLLILPIRLVKLFVISLLSIYFDSQVVIPMFIKTGLIWSIFTILFMQNVWHENMCTNQVICGLGFPSAEQRNWTFLPNSYSNSKWELFTILAPFTK